MTYGKFASAEELLKGYNQLEKSFTQKCQQLAALKAAVLAENQQELPIEKTENSNDKTTLITAATTPTAETDTVATENQNETIEIATESNSVAEEAPHVEQSQAATDNAHSSDSENAADVANNTDSTAPSQDSEKCIKIDTERTAPDDANVPKALAADTNEEESHTVNTKSPKTLASARDAATKLFESSNTVSPDGTSVETPPSSAEQSTTVDSADTVPQSEADAPVLDGHASAFSPTESQLQQYLLNNPQIAWQLLQQTSQPPQIMTGGGNVSLALPSRPKTIKEASLMAKQLFKN